MLISLNWIREFVDLPTDLSPVELADRFTLTCAEVERVEPIEVGAEGLICAEIRELEPIGGGSAAHLATLDIGEGRTVATVTAAPNLGIGDRVVYAPTGASLKKLGKIIDAKIVGRDSMGTIPPGDALGIELAAREAVFLSPHVAPGTALDAAMFDDWVVEVDNHSINHRPDLWGQYGMAREFAAIFDKKLKPYPVTPRSEMHDASLPELPIEIDDSEACPRYSALVMKGVDSQPGPLWMQLRLGHVGLRPIDCLVDLTNYIMMELGQPMHAFDGDNIERIEVGTAKAGTKFTTLDNVERTLPEGALMIMAGRKPVALAGIMGGADSEISETTQTVLLESANFNPYVIRKCTTALGHRTDASARFEKSLDPAHTMLGIERFVHLAKNEFPKLTFISQLSDCYPKHLPKVSTMVDPEFVKRFIGHPVTRDDIRRILTALEFEVHDEGELMRVDAPSFRATRDIEIEADIIEEVARYVGLNNIVPTFPEVSVRALDVNPLQRLERNSLRVLAEGAGMIEIHGYLWHDNDWCRTLGYDPSDCLTLRNPPAAGSERLRQSMIPGLLAAANLNRRHLSEFRLMELGSVFPRTNGENVERRRIGIVTGVRGKGAEDRWLLELKGAIETWASHVLSQPATFHSTEASPKHPWEHSAKIATVRVAGHDVGRISTVPFELRRKIDEHLVAWSLAWAEIELDALADMPERVERLSSIPAHPEVELDFSVLADATTRYANIAPTIAEFSDPLLRRITFVGSYEGKSLPAGKRSITLRARIGDPIRTLVDEDLKRFREAFQDHLAKCGLEEREEGTKA